MDKARFDVLKQQVDEQEEKIANNFGRYIHPDNLNPLGTLSDQKALFARIAELERENERLKAEVRGLTHELDAWVDTHPYGKHRKG